MKDGYSLVIMRMYQSYLAFYTTFSKRSTLEGKGDDTSREQ
jgi:hypothetical protein